MSYDESNLDQKYFIDDSVYNCPFCKRRNVVYELVESFAFNWSREKPCAAHLVQCSSCRQVSLHLSYEELRELVKGADDRYRATGRFAKKVDLDGMMFFHQPSSFFTVDNRIPGKLRALVSEAEVAHKMGLLTGASACIRKAVYEFLGMQSATGDDYQSRVKSLKGTFPNVYEGHFDALATALEATSDNLHELSWENFDGSHVRLFLETLKEVFHEVYVVPAERTERRNKIQSIRDEMAQTKAGKSAAQSDANTARVKEKQ